MMFSKDDGEEGVGPLILNRLHAKVGTCILNVIHIINTPSSESSRADIA